ncbi:peptidylprolyl isomerase [Blattabacterium cuenoti]|uniref:peptidylprolyl isomerase n=1 Tax=Blattabacterium cuenoti TaxID=1653831 RepID=UPI00163D1831|nr:peptidylprolyl isomerase [Blattabacterium cuenoti]
MFNKFYLIILLFFLSFSFSLERIGGISAIIDNEIILDSEVKSYLYNHQNMSFQQAIKNLLTNKLILLYEKKDPNIDKKELELKIENIIFNIKDQFNNTNKKNNLYFKEFLEKLTEDIKNNYYIEKFYKKIMETIDLSPEEVKYFINHKKKEERPISPKQIYISYIKLYPKINLKNKKNILNFLKKIKKEIHTSSDFSTKAILFSEDLNTALKGGIIKGIKKNSLDKKFENIVFSLKEKQISDPFETNLGFHLVFLEKINENKRDIKHILIKNKYTEEELIKIKNFAYYLKKKLLKNNFSLQKKNYTSKIVDVFIFNNILFNEKNISKKMKKALNNLKNGEISIPYQEIIDGKNVFFIVKLLKCIPGHPFSFEKDYSILKEYANKMKQQEIIKNWVKIQLKKTFFKIDNSIIDK